MFALFVAIVSPLDPAAEVLFSLHMVQHLLLVLVAAPLLVLGAPDVAGLWALGEKGRNRVGRGWHRLVRRTEGVAGGENGVALLSVLIAAGTLWVWHVPDLYDTAVRREGVHAAEHLTFLLTALFFWASVLRLRPRDHLGNGVRIILVFFMAVQGSVLGALITFAQRPLYESHAAIPAVWGIAPLADQQLAGLIMWVPPALLYIGVAAYLFVRWLDSVGRRTREREARVRGISAIGAGSGRGVKREEGGVA
jgi:cytochrome c oxidase assembly factor CtaG